MKPKPFHQVVSVALFLGITLASCNQPATADEFAQMNKDFAKALNAKDAVAAARGHFRAPPRVGCTAKTTSSPAKATASRTFRGC